MAPLPRGSPTVIVGITGYVRFRRRPLCAERRISCLGYGSVDGKDGKNRLRAVYKKEGVDVRADKLQFVTLDDLYSQSKFETTFAGADGVVHPALPTPSGPRDWVENIIESTLIPFRAASKAGIMRFILATTRPPFELTVVIPLTNWDPELYGSPAISLDWLDKLRKGDETCPSIPPFYIVDVPDDAKLLVLALPEKEADGKRLVAVGTPHGWNEVLAVLRKYFPNRRR
ncbi:hypothetical protein CALVIDRAFT_568365 [Calocera viscosa TUFC12733]|uniref:NAD(P)-binding protein n=1 Tax=Calocera viscosa (strain TUFC12733) TaxID=1330018 RepID=A0A167H7Z1_CALVF|nr:hypothetical protein CALVIDRAFT_568365 [Calocera viscosa TUFC12733]